MQDEIIVSLENPVCLTVSGSDNYYRELVIKAPTSKHQKHYVVLKSAIIKSFMKSEQSQDSDKKESSESESSSDITAEQVIMLLMMSDIDTDKIFEAFKGILFTPKTALFDNTIEMNQLLYDKLSMGDIENALGEYINVFIVGSLKKAS
jgi:hypothetical protein